MLIDESKKQNKPYGLYFDDITGGFTTTQRAGLQAFSVMPVIVYKVFADGRPDELIRGADIVGTPLASFAKIIATSDKRKSSTATAEPNRAACRSRPFRPPF
jgi:TldD protein